MKRLYAFLALLNAIAVSIILTVPSQVKAFPNGVAEYEGYFSAFVEPNTATHWNVIRHCDGISPVFTSSTTKATFISEIKEYLANGKLSTCATAQSAGTITRNKTGAAFIIQSMRDGGTNARNRPPTASDIADWEARLGNATMTYQSSKAFSYNSGYMMDTTNDSDARDDDSYYNRPGTADSLVFTVGGVEKVMIKADCANINGGVGLPKVVDWSISGQSSVSAATAIPGTTVTFTHMLKNAGPDDATGIWWTARNVTTGGAVASGGPVGEAKNNVWSTVNTNNFTIPAGAAAGATYCQHVEYGPVTNGGGISSSPDACVTVVYDYELHPIAAPPASPIVLNGQTATFTFSLRNDGPTVTNSTWLSIRKLTIPPGTNLAVGMGEHDDVQSCAFYAPATCSGVWASAVATYAVGTSPTITSQSVTATSSDTPGTRLCYVLSVVSRDEGPTIQGGLIHNRDSAIACVTVAKSPTMAIVGGDGSAGGSTYVQCPGQAITAPGDTNHDGVADGQDCTPVVAAAPCQGTAGFTGVVATGFGSFGEYGLVATGGITGFGSAGLLSPSSTYTSFANTTTPAGTYMSTHCIQDYAALYQNRVSGANPLFLSPGAIPAGSQSYRVAGDVQINASNLTSGQQVLIYAPNNTVTIAGNITYQTSSYTDFADVPSLVVVAKRIAINSNVQQIDGVYYAFGAGAVGNGYINTCAEATDDPNADLNMIKDGGTCKNPLVINGAIISRKLVVPRTAGGSVSTDPPAEIVRMRPESFLTPYAISTSVPTMTTQFSKELPARY